MSEQEKKLDEELLSKELEEDEIPEDCDFEKCAILEDCQFVFT